MYKQVHSELLALFAYPVWQLPHAVSPLKPRVQVQVSTPGVNPWLLSQLSAFPLHGSGSQGSSSETKHTHTPQFACVSSDIGKSA